MLASYSFGDGVRYIVATPGELENYSNRPKLQQPISIERT